MDPNRKFRTAYVTQNVGSFDFSSLLGFCERIVFVTTGYEAEDTLLGTVQKVLADYDPSLDLLVPVGNVTVNMLIGAVAMVLGKGHGMDNSITVTFYREQRYHAVDVWVEKEEM